MDNWDEVRTAYHVAREGTVSAAASALGVHHATVIRHIDALEARLGAKLFQRHARGYTPTEAGADLLQVAQTTDDQLSQLESRLKGRGNEVGGELVVTTIAGLSGLMAPVLTSFQAAHPSLVVRYLISDRVFRLEYGEAHVALRAGPSPQEPDNVVQAFRHLNVGLYATREYLERRGRPRNADELDDHDFAVVDPWAERGPFTRWLGEKVGRERLVFRATESQAVLEAILAGAGIGFVARWVARDIPELVEVFPAHEDWHAPLWLVTHMDLHRTAKVQAFLKHLKKAEATWDL